MFDDEELENYDKSSHRRVTYVKINNDHIAYLKWVFRFDDIPQPYKKPEPIVIVEVHPFENWI